jgi:hypothetical protein
MIQIKIGKNKFRGIYSWSDITIQKFCELADIAMPPEYDKFLQAEGKFSIDKMDDYLAEISKITDKQLNEEFPVYYRQVVKCLTNIPDSILDKLDPKKINELYEYYFKPFVISIIYNIPFIHFMGQLTPWQPENIKSFRIGLQKFYLPKSVNILNEDVPLAKEPIITYIEASNVFQGMRLTTDQLERMALFMAIYCRKKHERYNEQKTAERKELFMKTPMSVFWSVFFYIIRRLPDSPSTILLFGKLPKTMTEIVSAARVYQNTD